MPVNKISPRNSTLDFVKLIAALGVVSLHVGYYPELPGYIGDFIRYSMRWTVPFFFISFGYFICDFGSSSYYLARIQKVTLMAIIANFIYLPAVFYRDGWEAINLILTFDVMFNGTYLHLWFFSSLLFALFMLNFIELFSRKWIVILSFFIILGYLLSDILRTYGLNGKVDANFFRFLSSIPFVYLGYIFRDKRVIDFFVRLNHMLVVAVVIIILGLEFILLAITNGDLLLPQFGVASFLLSIVLFSLCIKYPHSINIKFFNIQTTSLGIYIFHPLILAINYKFMMLFNFNSSLFLWLSACLVSILSTVILSLYFPKAMLLINGVFPAKLNKLKPSSNS